MTYVPYILLFIAACAWGGMVFEDAEYQSEARWPLIWAPFVVIGIIGIAGLAVMAITSEIVIRAFTLGGYGVRDLD